MTTETTLEIQPSELAQIVESVFSTMMNLEVGEGVTPWISSPDRITSAVHLTGDWNGAVILECDRVQACRLSGRFLSMDPPDQVDDDVRDVLGELGNMIGGNLKCVLTSGIRISMPTVTDGDHQRQYICGSEVLNRVALQCAEGPFWIIVLRLKP